MKPAKFVFVRFFTRSPGEVFPMHGISKFPVRGALSALALAVVAFAGPALAQTPGLVNAVSPGTTIGPALPAVQVPVTLSRDATTPVLGFSVRIQLSAEFDALTTGGGDPDIVLGDFLTAGGRSTNLQVISNGGGNYTVDGVTLGGSCGPASQTGTLFTVRVRSSAAAATGTVTIQSVTMRDCNNQPLSVNTGSVASVTIDNTPPVVTVTAPNGGETWSYQSTHAITWSASDASGTVPTVSIDYSTDGGSGWTAVATGEPNDGSYSWAVPNTPSTTALVRVRATDSNGNPGADVSDAVFTIVSNTAPVLTPVAPQTVNEGTNLHLVLAATDGESPPQTLKFYLQGSPPAGATLTEAGVFDWNPSEAQGPGSYTIDVRVEDDGTPALSGTGSFGVTVNEVNVAPTLDISTAMSLPAILEDTGPAATGATVAQILASGAGGNPVSDPDNGAQRGIAIADAQANAGGVWEFSMNGGSSWSPVGAVALTSALLLADEPGNRVRFLANADWNGTVTLQLLAWDRTSGSDGGTASVTTRGGGTAFSSAVGVANHVVTPVNDAPLFNAPADQTVLEDPGTVDVNFGGVFAGPLDEWAGPTPQVLSFAAVSSDPSIVPNPTITGSGTARVLHFTPAANANGTVTITLTATDDGGTADGGVDATVKVFSITVTPVNDRPDYDAIADQSVSEDPGPTAVSITGVGPGGGADEAGQSVGFAAVSGNPAVVPDPVVTGSGATRTLTFQPAANATGTAIITVTATDDGGTANGGVDSRLRTFTINVTAQNDPPVLANVPTGTIDIPELVAYAFQALGSDVDIPSQPLTFSLQGTVPAGATINPGTGAFAWTPDESQGPGDYPFTVRLSDGVDFVEASFTLRVTEVNVAPVLGGAPAAATIPELVAYTFTATGSDADLPAQTLTFSLSGEPAGAAIDGNSGVFTWTPSEAQGPGVHPFKVRLGDGVATTEFDVVLTVTEVSVAAITDLTASAVRTGNDGDGTERVTLGWTATPGGTTVQVYRARYGDYPLYGDGSGSPPAPPASATPGPPWELTAVTAPGQTDEVNVPQVPKSAGGRDYWYYVAFVHGAGANVSGPSNQPASLNYLLGDFADGSPEGLGVGNNRVFTEDITALGGSYGFTGAAVAPVRYLDVGPTSDYSVNGLPLPDQAINFEDLVMLAINFGTGPQPQLAAKPAAGGAARDALIIEAPKQVSPGETFAVRLRVTGAGRVQALSAALDWAQGIAEPVGVHAGAWLDQLGGVAFSPKPGAVDVALLGARESGFAGDGVVATVEFRALAAGDPAIALGSARARDAWNRAVDLAGSVEQTAPEIPATTMLSLPFPNPSRGEATIAFGLARPGPVRVVLYGVDGRAVRTLADGAREAGVFRLTWDGRDDDGRPLAAGIYFVRMTSAQGTFTKRISHLR